MSARDCTRRAQSFWTTCDCPPCVLDRRRKHKLYSMGRITRVPSDDAWAILAERIDDGWTARALASACGLPEHYFSSLVADYRAGKRQAIGPNIAAAVVNMGTPTSGSINARGSRRRLRALARIGYGLDTLAAETEVGATTLAMIRSSNVRVTAVRANAIAAVYERLCMTPGPDVQAVQGAMRKGWAPPLAYDDIEADDEPTDWEYLPPTREEQLGEWVDQGLGISFVCQSLRISKDSLERWCHRKDLRHLFAALTAREYVPPGRTNQYTAEAS